MLTLFKLCWFVVGLQFYILTGCCYLMITNSLRPVYEFVYILFRTDMIISTVLEQVDHGGQDGNAAQTRIRDETSDTDHTQK